ncbi:hypothetical protein JR316_0013182 [Psilocybe cubensis]|uniref:Uncharacterized protein n=2 Tax=Psilocybe cubensis TaxID=181762 RepID=A0ACB8GGS4_PSICU|nr:hypothetical protein JR316_0013182 [Psilocybe cubensis]KAH9474717.1 hypothetical protein JR316_0013182 [Psilocybe cubensis]
MALSPEERASSRRRACARYYSKNQSALQESARLRMQVLRARRKITLINTQNLKKQVVDVPTLDKSTINEIRLPELSQQIPIKKLKVNMKPKSKPKSKDVDTQRSIEEVKGMYIDNGRIPESHEEDEEEDADNVANLLRPSTPIVSEDKTHKSLPMFSAVEHELPIASYDDEDVEEEEVGIEEYVWIDRHDLKDGDCIPTCRECLFIKELLAELDT